MAAGAAHGVAAAMVYGNDQYTKVLLHFDGSDAGTTITDYPCGATAHTWTAVGNAQLDTADSKFAGCSLLLDGTGDYITTPDSADFAVGSSNFTYDFWIKRGGGLTTRMGLFGQVDAGGGAGCIDMEINTSNQLRVIFTYNTGVNTVVELGGTISDTTTWHHVGVIRNGNTLYTSLDGTFSAGSTVTGLSADNAAGVMHIGRLGLFGNGFNGWMDEFRFSNGIARWTTSFVAPAQPYG